MSRNVPRSVSVPTYRWLPAWRGTWSASGSASDVLPESNSTTVPAGAAAIAWPRARKTRARGPRRVPGHLDVDPSAPAMDRHPVSGLGSGTRAPAGGVISEVGLGVGLAEPGKEPEPRQVGRRELDRPARDRPGGRGQLVQRTRMLERPDGLGQRADLPGPVVLDQGLAHRQRVEELRQRAERPQQLLRRASAPVKAMRTASPRPVCPRLSSSSSTRRACVFFTASSPFARGLPRAWPARPPASGTPPAAPHRAC